MTHPHGMIFWVVGDVNGFHVVLNSAGFFSFLGWLVMQMSYSMLERCSYFFLLVGDVNGFHVGINSAVFFWLAGDVCGLFHA